MRHGLHFFCYAGVKYLEQLAGASNKILLEREREREKRNKQNRAQPIDGCYVNNGYIVGAFCIFSVVVMAPALFILDKRGNGRMSFL